MKPQILKLLTALLIFNAAFLISAKAQIVYTDVNPDVTYSCGGNCSHQYYLDLNGDSTMDFTLESVHSISASWKTGESWQTSYVKITPLGQNAFVTENSSAKVISIYEKIDSLQPWKYSASQYLKYYSEHKHGPIILTSGNSGNWNSVTDRFIGLKINSNNKIYYGWIKLNVSVSLTSGLLTIKDFAYDSISNHFILAGESSCSIPTVTLSASGPLTFCNGSYVTLTANGTGHLYQWKKNGVNLSGATYQNLNVSTAGKYKCTVTNTCGSKTSKVDTVIVPCRNSDASFLNTTNGEELDHITVYPNPATNSVTIKFPRDESGEIQIINLFGRIVVIHNCASLRDNELKIDISNFPSGIYMIRKINGENIQTKNFSVIK